MSLVRVKMSSELHRKFRRWAFDSGTTMQAALMGAAEVLCGKHVEDVGKVAPSKSGATPLPAATMEPGTPWKRCFKCKEPTNKPVPTKDGKVLCQDCAKDLAGAIP